MSIRPVIIKSAAIAALTVAFSVVLYYACGKVLSYFGVDTTNLTYLSNYYNWENGDAEKRARQDEIVVLNTQDLDERNYRQEIAELVDSLFRYNPKVVGIDIRFVSPKDSASDAYLKRVVAGHSDRIVLDQASHRDSVFRSIFDGEDVCFGLTNLPRYERYAPFQVIKGKKYPTFSYQVFRKACPDREIDFDRFIVNYSSVSFRAFDATAFDDLTPESKRRFFEDKIVLLGETDNDKDYHNTPFKIEGNVWEIGVYLHAYAIYSLISPDRAYRSLHPLWNILICFVLCFLFSLIYVTITYDRVVSRVGFLRRHPSIAIIARPVLVIVADLLVLALCYLVFTKPFKIVPDVVFYMVSVLLIKTFSDYLSYRINDKK